MQQQVLQQVARRLSTVPMTAGQLAEMTGLSVQQVTVSLMMLNRQALAHFRTRKGVRRWTN